MIGQKKQKILPKNHTLKTRSYTQAKRRFVPLALQRKPSQNIRAKMKVPKLKKNEKKRSTKVREVRPFKVKLGSGQILRSDTDSWKRLINAWKLKKPTCFFKNLQLLKFKEKKTALKLFEFIELMMNTFLLILTQFEKTGSIGKTFILL